MFRRKTKDERRENVIATLNLFQGKQPLSRRSKYGVSLITVLLFMLVATIAATATYKWITSEGRSSASRMMQREAYQSSIAGIENARSWITYHANDVGALIRQYLNNDSHKPISLDDRLRPLQKQGQDYHVWLVGVNTESSTYKLKILSSGEARGDTRHSEVAIFNVDGLYQVKVPQENHHSDIEFDYAYFGGGFQSTQVKATSAIVNGDWSGNPPIVEKNWVVTGNATLSGNDVKVGETACIGGNASIQNTGFKGKDLYVVGDFTGNIEISGDAYLGGNVTQGSAGNFAIGGSVTLDGRWTTSQGGKSVTIGGNLCTGESGQVYSSGTNHPFTVEGNVWMPGHKNVWTGWDNENYYDKIILGNSSESEAYIADYISSAQYNAKRNEKEFTEISTYKKYCPTPISSKDEFRIAKNGSTYSVISSSDKDVCGSWKGVEWHKDWGMISGKYYVDYERGWQNWAGGKYKPYKSITEKTDKYSLYYTNGKTDVSFGEYSNTDWKYFTSKGYNAEWIQLNWARDYDLSFNDWSLDQGYSQMGGKFSTPTPVGAYSVGDNIFYNLKQYNTFNYDNNTITGSPYCKKSSDAYRPECGVTPWFKSNGIVSNNVTDERKFSCAETVKDNCDNIWVKESNCGTGYQVKDVLVTAKDKFESYANKGCAAGITNWPQTGFEKLLNDCYRENIDDEGKKKTNLYNGFLVVKISSSDGNYGQSADKKLKGKFIIIVENQLGPGQNGLPMVEDGSFVFLYLKQGAGHIQKEVKNYFIYTEKDIGESSGLHLTGTVYAPTASCAKANFKDATLTFSQEVIDEMTSAAIICSNDGSTCGGATGGVPSASTSEDSYTSGTDSYYISNAPQLGVSLESQYENNETLPSEANQASPTPSFIVLPRVIYLPTDPYGELENYYNVIPLNGSTLKKSEVAINCGAGIPTSGKLYPSGGTPLTEGIYTCEASANGYSKVPFWVVVKGSQRGTPTVSFIEDSQEMSPTGSAQVHVSISAHDQPITLTVSCPMRPDGWNYTLNGGSESDGKCTFEIPANTSGSETRKLFDVTTSDAVNGTLTFHLQTGEGYALSSPYSAELHVSSSATLNRIAATQDEVNTYCASHPEDCPEAGFRGDDDWPLCNTDETWVEPSGVSFGINTKNQSWSVSLGGTGNLTLAAKPSADCIVIIPSENNSIDKSTIVANNTYELRATAKAKKHSLKVAYKGDVGDGKNPFLIVKVNGRNTTCVYDDVKGKDPKSCTVSVFSGEGVSISIDKDNGANKNFSYWKCDNNGGTTCPTIDPITSQNYSEFTVKDDNAIVYAYFGESDKHCFFDEFKNGSIGCYGDETEYCIDRCGNDVNSTCNGAVDANGVFSKSKWHLLSGTLDDIDSQYGNISLDKSSNKGKNRSNMAGVKVISTVNAGLYGTLKALVQLPKATPSFGNASENIAKSGFMLRSNAAGSEYLMLNLYANENGYLEARLCRDGGTSSCLKGTPVKGGSKASVGAMSMVMMAATLTDDNKLSVSAFVGNFYGSPDEYTLVFDLSDLSNNYGSRDHEFVGFSMADPNFKIYGIGWKSEDYDSECHDTYPTVKCSFAAVAPNGVVPTEENVKPWIGHSGWFDSKAYSCTESYYYYNGDDAGCGIAGESGVTCPSTGYKFSESGAGQHGYVENGKDMKTAKAWLKCSLSPEDGAWAVETEAERAHCGPFWTGKLTECTDHADLANVSAVSSGEEKTLPLAAVANLRGSTLNVSMQNSDNNEIEIWLLSENANWGSDDFASRSVKFKGNGGSFEVTGSFADGAQGFDPEHVKQIVIKNLGGTSVTDVTITSACKNAVGISNCVAQYNDGTGKWTITAEVTNKDKVTAYSVEGTVDGSSVIGISDAPSWTLDQAKWEKTDNPYGNYQGKTFKFTASVTNQGGTVLSTQCNDVAITSVSCSNLSASDVESGETWPQLSFKLNNCPNNKCVYTIKLDGRDAISGQEGYGNVSKTPAGNSPECNTDGGCEHTYTVASASAEVPFNECSKTFKVKKKVTTEVTATCSVGGSLYQGQELELNVSNITNISGNVDMIWSMDNSTKPINCDATHCWNNKMNAPTATGTYSYTLTYNGNTVCTGSVDIGPALTCSVSPTTLGRGDDYIFTANGNLHCWNCSFTDASGSVENNLEVQKNGTLTKTKKANNTGSKTLTLACNSCDNNISASCSAPLTINAAAPAFSCPTNQSETVGNTVSITPQGLVGCEDGCSYTISGTSVTGSGYTSGALPSFSGASSAGTMSYTVSLTNSVNTTSHDCSINYVSVSSILTASCPATISTFPLKNFDWGITTSGNGSLADDETLVRNLYIDDTYISSKDCKKYDCQNMDRTNAPATPGTYTYSLKVGSEELCHGSLVVQNPIVCSAQPSGITWGNSITVKASWANGVDGQPSECSLSGSGVPSGGNCNYLWNFNSDISITPASTGTQNYTYSAKLSNNGKSAGPFECEWSVNVTMPKPTFSCPTTITATVGEANNVTITPQNVTGCGEGSPYCKYAISGTSVSGSNYSSGSLPSFTNNTTTAGNTATYTVSLTNSAGTTSHDCSVEFTAGSSAIPVTISYQDYKSFTPGNTYTLTFSGSSGSVFRCTYTDRAYSFKMGVYDGSDWNVGGYTGGQATKSNPGDGAVKTFVVDSDAPTDLKCATDW